VVKPFFWYLELRGGVEKGVSCKLIRELGKEGRVKSEHRGIRETQGADRKKGESRTNNRY
jgi:hypothetical protein